VKAIGIVVGILASLVGLLLVFVQVGAKYNQIQVELGTHGKRIDELDRKIAATQESLVASRVPERTSEPAQPGSQYQGEMGVLSPHDMMGLNSEGKRYDPEKVFCEINRYSTMVRDGNVCPGVLLVVENMEQEQYDKDGTASYRSMVVPANATTSDSLRPQRLGLLSPEAARKIGLTRNKGVTWVRVTVTSP
jgi:hypothetical protein